ncbi:unnamed protein product [Brassica oleracea]|uniref:(rape) hypothetical protein n=1 Tax=Brassica napus TaxID=3708 RepID=A0A816IUU8_BRANA|nr:unnamed protein product [Brassica napus]
MRRHVSVLWVSSPVFSQLACRFFVTSREVFFLPEVSCFAWALGFHFGPFVVLLEIFGLRTIPIPGSQISKSNDPASASASPFMLVAKDEVIDRKTKRLVEELIRLKDFSVHDSYLPVQNLGLDLWIKDQINMAEVKYPLQHFKVEKEIVFIVSTLHSDEFFIRELKPGARTMAYMNRDDVAVCAADCRLMVFQSVEDSTRFWIKGRKFSIRGLFGKNVNRNAFLDGSLVIFRLAPQDYHGFHVPVSGVIEKFGDVSGSLYTVNPIAINSKYCNEFTENNRTLAIISTSEFGKVHFTQNPLSLHAALEVG